MDERTPPRNDDPGYQSVRDYLLFGLSLPERTLRSAAGMAAGALRESASLLIPQAFQDSKTYDVLIRQTLDFLAEDVGGAAKPSPDASSVNAAAPRKTEDYVARKTVSTFLDLAGWATLHVSPLTVLAIVNDVAYGSQFYLQELSRELKKQGVIDEDSTINHVDDLLKAAAKTANATASTFDAPPLSVDGLKATVDQIRESVGSMDLLKTLPQAEVQRLWDEIGSTAAEQGVNPWALSSAMTLFAIDKVAVVGRGALSTVRVTGNLINAHIIDHYREALGDVRRQGFYAFVAGTSKPYIDAVWRNFSTEKTTVTEDLLSGKLVGDAWNAVRRLLGRE